MKNEKEMIKENTSYNNHNKKCNSVLLALSNFEEFVEDKEGRSDHENYLLMILEQEVHALQHTIEAYKKELDNNHYNAIEELK